MKAANISKSVLSLSSTIPGTAEQVRRLARSCNEYAESLKKEYPDNFGYWATLPLPDVDGSLAEIAYLFDNFNPDGVRVLTNHNGIYLGDAQFDPIFAELSKRNITLFIHPAVPCVSTNTTCIPALPLPGIPTAIGEYLFDQTRAFMNLFHSGTIDRYPGITYIITHG